MVFDLNNLPSIPSGLDTQIQFNDSGAFGGATGLIYSKSTQTTTLAIQKALISQSKMVLLFRATFLRRLNFLESDRVLLIFNPSQIFL